MGSFPIQGQAIPFPIRKFHIVSAHSDTLSLSTRIYPLNCDLEEMLLYDCRRSLVLIKGGMRCYAGGALEYFFDVQ